MRTNLNFDILQAEFVLEQAFTVQIYVFLLFYAEYLQANKYNSLQVQALHDLGNLHFYNGNRKYDSLHYFPALIIIN